MTKNHTEQTGSNLLAHPGRTSDSSPKNTVSKQMSLSGSILSGAVVSYRKAGYTFGRHLHTNIDLSNSFRRMLYGYSIRNPALYKR